MKTAIILIFLSVCSSITSQWLPDVRFTNHPDSSLTSPNNARCIIASGSTIHAAWNDNRDGNYEIYYKRSTDDGVTWGSDTRLTTDNAVSQRPSLAVSGNFVHMVWNDRVSNEEIYYKQSTNSGLTWGSGIRLTNDPNLSTYPSIAASSNLVVTAWGENRDGNYEIYYKSSTDYGITWGADTRLTNDAAVSLQACVVFTGSTLHISWHDNRNSNDEVYYRRSTDGGQTWEAEVRITTLPGASFFASMHAAGNLVLIAWVENSDGNPEIYSRRSTDLGITWEANVRHTNNAAISIRPTVSITGSNIHLVYQDNVDGNDEIYYRVSTNSGQSFSSSLRLSNDTAYSVYPCHTVSDAGIHAIWRDFRDGNWELYYKRNPTGNLVNIQILTNEFPTEYMLSQNYPNPFNPVTNIKFSVAKTGLVKLSVFDITGKEMAMLVNEELNAGTYNYDFNALHLSNGIYFYRLETNNFTETKKMVLVK